MLVRALRGQGCATGRPREDAIGEGRLLLRPDRVLDRDDALTVACNEIQVWALHLAADRSTVERCRKLLSRDELSRAMRFVSEDHSIEFILAHGALRHILGRYLGAAPRSIIFNRGSAGKPIVAGGSNKFSFNLSHSHGRAVVAIGRGREVGIDVEQESPSVDCSGIACAYFSRSEADGIQAVGPARRCAEFFRYWVAKEAVLKGEGLGLLLVQLSR